MNVKIIVNMDLNLLVVTMTETGRNKYFGSEDKGIVDFRIIEKIMELKIGGWKIFKSDELFRIANN